MFEDGERVFINFDGNKLEAIILKKYESKYLVKMLDNSKMIVSESQISK